MSDTSWLVGQGTAICHIGAHRQDAQLKQLLNFPFFFGIMIEGRYFLAEQRQQPISSTQLNDVPGIGRPSDG